jgi:hypothetical protein
MFKRILVGIDGGARSGDAIRLAETLAGPQTELLLALAYPRAPQTAGNSFGAQHEEALRPRPSRSSPPRPRAARRRRGRCLIARRRGPSTSSPTARRPT